MKKFEIIVAEDVAWGPIIKSFTFDCNNSTPILKGIEYFQDERGQHFIFNVDDDICLDGLKFINENTLKKNKTMMEVIEEYYIDMYLICGMKNIKLIIELEDEIKTYEIEVDMISNRYNVIEETAKLINSYLGVDNVVNITVYYDKWYESPVVSKLKELCPNVSFIGKKVNELKYYKYDN